LLVLCVFSSFVFYNQFYEKGGRLKSPLIADFAEKAGRFQFCFAPLLEQLPSAGRR
jgi:hypothetical protein